MKLQNKSKYLRKLVIDMIKVRKGGHLGPALSLIEILHVLYKDILKLIQKNLIGPKEIGLFLAKVMVV